MPLALDKIKRDFARNKKKAGILALLAVALLGFTLKAVFDLSPRAASADAAALAAAANPDLAAVVPESEEHIRQSKELWTTLRQPPRGLDPALAFTFEPVPYYNPNPNRKVPAVVEHVEPVDTTPKVPVTSAEAQLAQRRAELLADVRTIIVRSTVVGSGISKPVAVINDQAAGAGDRILGVGDRIKGFEIIAIRAREVEFKKDGITLAVKMSDDARTR